MRATLRKNRKNQKQKRKTRRLSSQRGGILPIVTKAASLFGLRTGNTALYKQEWHNLRESIKNNILQNPKITDYTEHIKSVRAAIEKMKSADIHHDDKDMKEANDFLFKLSKEHNLERNKLNNYPQVYFKDNHEAKKYFLKIIKNLYSNNEDNNKDVEDFENQLELIKTPIRISYHNDIDMLTFLYERMNFMPQNDENNRRKSILDTYRSYLNGLKNRQIIQLAEALYKEGAGDLPPGWDYDKTEEGEYYFIKPDETTTWDDPREDLQKYVAEYVAAAKRGVNLNTLRP